MDDQHSVWWFSMSGEILGHSKGTDFVAAKNLRHLLVRGEVLPVFRILEVVLFQVSPKFFEAFGTACKSVANNVSQFGGELHGFGETGSFRHGDLRWFFGLKKEFRYRCLANGVSWGTDTDNNYCCCFITKAVRKKVHVLSSLGRIAAWCSSWFL